MKEITQELDVVGVKFCWKAELRSQLAAMCPLDVQLVREFDNTYDANAIAVKLTNETNLQERTHIGYIRADTAAILAPKMDDDEVTIIDATLVKLVEPDYLEGRTEVTMLIGNDAE